MPDSTDLNALTAVQQQVLQALVAGTSITAASQDAGVHRTSVHLWTRQHPHFARALLTARQDKADRMLDELGDLADLALNTFRQILTDEQASPATRLKAAMEVVKLVETQRPTIREVIKADVAFDRLDRDLSLAQTAQAAQTPKPPARATKVGRNAACPCGSNLKYKRCCGNPVSRACPNGLNHDPLG